MIHIHLFASFREKLGFNNFSVEFKENTTIGSILANPIFSELPDNVLFAINQKFADKNDIVKDGDEIAIMPPVSGG